MIGRSRWSAAHRLVCSMLAGISLSLVAAEAEFRFDPFTDVEALELVGDAHRAAERIRLVSTAIDQRGAVWTRAALNVAKGFDTYFTFGIGESSDPSGDGFAFVISGDADVRIGGTGASIGYDLIPKSVAIEFDTYYNPTLDDPNGNHISVHSRGALPNSRHHRYSLGYTTDIPNLTDGEPHQVWIHYRPPSLIVCIDDPAQPVLLAPVDLTGIPNGQAWIGFTAGTGDAFGNYEIVNWAFTEPRSAIRVPDDLPTIQAAIDAAPDWSVVVVSPGTYAGEENVSLDLRGKPIHLLSREGPRSTVIDCEGRSRGFDLFREETAASVVEGFTIRHGATPDLPGGRCGGAVVCSFGSGPTFLRCVFELSRADSLGGAVYCGPGSKPRFWSCMFLENRAGGDGGALFVDRGSKVWLANSLIARNSAGGAGGGVRALGEGTLRNCSIVGNRSDLPGGGIASEAASGSWTLTNCVLWADRPDEIGGIVQIDNSSIDGGWTGREDTRLVPWRGNISTAPSTVLLNGFREGLAPSALRSRNHPSRRGEWRADWPVTYPAGPAPVFGFFETP